MENVARDRISREFADLTALLEDAAGLAVEGQSLRRSPAELRDITTSLRPLLMDSLSKLVRIERALAEGEGDGDP